MSEVKISLGALFALHDRLCAILDRASAFEASRAALEWVDEQGFLTEAEERRVFVHMTGCQPGDLVILGGGSTPDPEIPAGPQAHPEAAAAGDLNSKAAVSVDGPVPEGAEGFAPSPVDAPAPPVAGGGRAHA